VSKCSPAVTIGIVGHGGIFTLGLVNLETLFFGHLNPVVGSSLLLMTNTQGLVERAVLWWDLQKQKPLRVFSTNSLRYVAFGASLPCVWYVCVCLSSVHMCVSVHACVCVCWCVFVGVCLLGCVCWGVFVGVCLLVCVCWCVFVGVCLFVCVSACVCCVTSVVAVTLLATSVMILNNLLALLDEQQLPRYDHSAVEAQHGRHAKQESYRVELPNCSLWTSNPCLRVISSGRRCPIGSGARLPHLKSVPPILPWPPVCYIHPILYF